MRLVKRVVIAVVLFALLLVSPVKSSVQAQDDMFYFTITEFPQGDVCNSPYGLFPVAVTGLPMGFEAYLGPTTLVIFHIYAPGLWEWLSLLDPDGHIGSGVVSFPSFRAYNLPADTTILIEVEVFRNYEDHDYGGLSYRQILEINCSTGDILTSDETYF